MCIPFRLLLVGTLGLGALPHKVRAAELQIEHASLQQCGAYSQAEMRACLKKASDESNERLRHAEKQAFSALAGWDEDAKFVDLAKKKLQASSKAHQQYRDAQCAFVSALAGGAIGHAVELRRISCIIKLNVERTQQLKTESATLPLKLMP